MKSVITSTPGKLMLFGEHAVVYGRPCLVTAVDQRLKAEVLLVDGAELIVNAPDVGVNNYTKQISEVGTGGIPKGVAFVEWAVANFRDKYSFDQGISIETKSDFSARFGFGSSSASTVCVVKALGEVLENNLSDKEIFDLSYKTVLDVQGKGSGFDIAAAVYGGTLFFQNAGEVIEPLDLPNGFNLVVGYSGTKADTVEMINKVKQLEEKDKKFVDGIYDRMGEISVEAREAMEKTDWERVGKLMNENQKLLVELGVSTEKLDAMISSAVGSGAYGAKLSGAGGGDCMIAICADEKKEDVKNAIENVGGEIMNVKVNAEGARVEN